MSLSCVDRGSDGRHTVLVRRIIAKSAKKYKFEAIMTKKNAGFRNGMVREYRIYPEQNIAARKIIDIFNEWSGPPLLITQPQQGKTGVAIAVADKLAKACYAENKKICVLLFNKHW